jgi:hypothetical protein
VRSAALRVRFGPWARNLYLGVPAALTFGLIWVVADMPPALTVFWLGMVLVVLWICALPRDVLITPGGRVIVTRRFLALLPVWRRSYPLDAFKAIKRYRVSAQVADSAPVDAATVYLVQKSGRHIPVQSYSGGADNQPPFEELVEALKAVTGLPYVAEA